MVAYYMFRHSDKEKVMSIWNKGKDAGNKAWTSTSKAATAVANWHVNGANKCVSGAKWAAGKCKFW